MSILSFDECALSLLLICIVSILVHGEYKSRTNKIMLALVCMIFIAIIGDIISGHNSNMNDPTPTRIAVTYAANYVYFFFHNGVMPLYLMYVYSSIDIWHLFVSRKAYIYGTVILIGIDTLVLALNGWAINVFSINDQCQFVRGPWETVFYVVAALYAICAFSSLIRYGRFINRDKQLVLLMLYIVVIGSMVMQLANINMMTEGFGMAIAVVIFLIAVKREEGQIDPITDAFKYHEGIHSITRALESKKPTTLIFIKITNDDKLRMYLGVEGYNNFLIYVTHTLNSIAKSNGYRGDLYYMENGLYTFMGETVDETKVTAVAEACRDLFLEAIPLGHYTVMTEAAICVAYCPEDTNDLAAVLKLGTTFHLTMPAIRNVCYYRDYMDDREFRIRNEIDSILKRAINGNGLRVYYQPIYSVSEKRYVAVEALVRLKDEKYGFVSPDDFITAAEQNGDIHDIGEFVIKDAISFISKADMDSLGLDYVVVNLSETECMEPDIVDRVKSALDDAGISSNMIAFEVQQSSGEINPEIIDSNIHGLHEMGARIILGGYGSGYSDMRRIIHMPIDQIKLDRKLVSLSEDPQMWEVIRSTIENIMEMGKEVRVVGIENEEAARKYSDLETSLIQGCSFVQGFFYCRPVTSGEVIEVVRRFR